MARKPPIKASLVAASGAERVHAYRVGLRVRASISQCLIEMRKGTVRFWIGGPGEEVHGTATALAMHAFDTENGVAVTAWESGLFPHYRSDALVTMLAELRGHPNFTRDYFRQALSRATDPMTHGRQMVMHVCDVAHGILPAQSPLGMNLPKAAGYARGRQMQELGGVTVAVCGDGTTATSDFHEAFTAASVWKLPLLIIVTDNEIAISVRPDEGRGIKDYASYAKAFGVQSFQCDGSDFDDTYATTLNAMRWVRDHGQTCLLHAKVPRLRGHSSSDGAVFRYDVSDPLLDFGQQLLAEGLVNKSDVFRRKKKPKKHDYLEDHVLGRTMQAELDAMRSTLEEVRVEPAPAPGDEYLHQRPSEAVVDEPETTEARTAVQINEALNLCLDRIFTEGDALAWGQDMAGEKGGVFKVTRGLCDKYPGRIVNAPINEPMIVGTAVGAAHHANLRVFPEIQFGDYSLNTLHWLVHAGNIYWGSGGQVPLNITLRTPVDPVAGGAIYHSMSVDGYFTPIQGWIIVCPSTAYDAYGLLRAASEYSGPVLFLEPKSLYRRAIGPALPGEPEAAGLRKTRRASGESLLSPGDLATVEDYRIPFGRAAVRQTGVDLTIVSWGNAVHQSMEAVRTLADESGLSVTVLDLRTLSPWDEDAVLDSVRHTGRLLVVHADRSFSGFGREIQGTVHEALDGVRSAVVGMRNVPAVGQAKELEEHTVLQPARIVAAARDLCRHPVGAFVENEDAWLQHAPTRRRT